MSYTFTKLGEVPTTELLNSEDMILVEQDGEIKRVSNEVFSMNGSGGGGGAVVFKGPFEYSDDNGDEYILDQNDNVVSNIDVVNAFKQGVVRFNMGYAESFTHGTMTGFYFSEGQLRIGIDGIMYNGDIMWSHLRVDNTIENPELI